MTIIDAVILGIVEGLSEFLPISSTGHLILAERIMGMASTEAVKSFDIVIQLGAIAAVVLLYWRSLILSRRTLLLVIAGFIPTGLIGLAMHGIIRTYFLGNITVVGWSLLLGGLFLVLFERLHREDPGATDALEAITFRQAVIIGTFQAIAIIPGVSRSAATIVGGLLLGLKRRTIVEFSFLLAVPTMLAASGLDLLRAGPSLTAHDGMAILIGFLTAFIIAIFAVRWFLRFIQEHTFTSFGIYRIIVGIAALVLWK